MMKHVLNNVVVESEITINVSRYAETATLVVKTAIARTMQSETTKTAIADRYVKSADVDCMGETTAAQTNLS